MISFYNQKFHENIMKKYGRIIRKSYFPNLFFRQDLKSSVPKNTHIFLHIKFNFYNNLLSKNFLLNYHKEKQPRYSFFLSEFKLFGLKHPESLRERSKFLNFKPEKNELSDLINHLVSTGFLYPNFIPSEPVNSEYRSFCPVSFRSFRLINHKTKTCNLHSSNSTTLFDTAPNHTYLNNSFANQISSYLKFFTLNLFENDKWMPFFKIGARFIGSRLNILRNCRNFFSKGKSLLFTNSIPSAVNEIIFQKVGRAAYYLAFPHAFNPALLPVSNLVVNKFSRKDHNEVLRRIEYLKFSDRTGVRDSRISEDFSKPLIISFISGRLKPFRLRESATENLKLRVDSKNRAKEKEMPYLQDSINILYTQPGSRKILDMNFIPSVRFVKNSLEKTIFFPYCKPLTGYGNGKTNRNTIHIRQKIVSIEPPISVFRQQERTINRLMSRIYEQIFSSPVNKYARSLQTVLKLSFFLDLTSNQVSRKARVFNWLTALTYNTAGVSQVNRQETSTGGSNVAYQLFLKPASELANITCNLAVNYPLSNSYAAYYHIARNYCIALSQEPDSKREELKSKKQFHFKINRLHNISLHHLFLKSHETTTSALKNPAILYGSGENVIQKVIFKASPAHRSFLLLAESIFSRKIRNEQVRSEFLRKVENLKLSVSGVLPGYISEKKSHAVLRDYRTSDKLLETLIRTYYSENFNRKPEISINAGESSQISKYSVLERPKPDGKKDPIERKVGQKPGELTISRNIWNTKFSTQNTKIYSSIQYLVLDFLKKTSSSYKEEHSPVAESNGINLLNVYKQENKQEKGFFQFSKKRIRQLLPVDVKLSAKKTITSKKVPGKFSRNLFMLQNVFLQEDVPGFPDTNILRPFKLFPFRGDLLLTNKNGIMSTGSSISPSASTSRGQESKSIKENKNVKEIKNFKESKNIINSRENIELEKKHLYSQYWPQKIVELLKFPVFFRTKAEDEGKNQTYIQKPPAVREQKSTETYIPEQPVQAHGFIAARTFNNLLNIFRSLEGRKSTGKVAHITDYLRDEYRLSGPHVADHYIISSQKAENKKELKTKKQLLSQFSRLNSNLVQPFFVISLETINRSMEAINYRFQSAEPLLYSNIQNFTYNNTSIPMQSLQNAQILNFQQKPPFNITSQYTCTYQGTAAGIVTLSSQAAGTQNYPEGQEFSHKKTYPIEYSTTLIRNLKANAINYPVICSFISWKLLHSSAALNKGHLERRTVLEKRADLALSGLSHFFLKKRVPQPLFSGVFLRRNVLKFFKISYPLSGTNTPDIIEYFSALSNRQNFVLKSTFSSNGLFSKRSFNASVPLLSETVGIASVKKFTQLFNLFKYADFITFQNPTFAGKPRFPSNKGSQSSKQGIQESKAASISRFTGMPELSGQKDPHWKVARMNLIPDNRKREYISAENFLQRDSANFPKRVKSSRQVNKKHYTTVVSRIIQRIYSDLILSTIPDFSTKTELKKVLSPVHGPDKKPEYRETVPGEFLFRFGNLQNLKNASESSTYPELKNTSLTFFALREEGGKTPGITKFGTSTEKGSELMHADGKTQKTGREDLAYGTSQPLLEEVKKIKRIIFETREIVADHLESHMPQVTGKPEKVMDIEDVSEKIMQSINRRLKIESERRGIF